MDWTPDELIERLGGDPELARQMAVLFVEECPNMLGAVRQSVSEGEPDGIRRAAHAFKGSVANFIHGGPAATALALEEAGREGRLADAPALLARLEQEVADLIPQMRAYGGSVCAS
jgi:two-component system, sensor histidine kinase and response regulator